MLKNNFCPPPFTVINERVVIGRYNDINDAIAAMHRRIFVVQGSK
jgi:hypothetical protein